MRPLTETAHDRVRSRVRAGDTVVDATVGNGVDAAFLAGLVGERGRVVGFDIQEAALAVARPKLPRHVTLVRESHHLLAGHVAPRSASAVMFNLGYLPGGDHAIVTRPETTVAALRAAVEVLRTDGILSVLCYRGHPGGREEYEAVERTLATAGGTIERVESGSGGETAPVLLLRT